MLCNVGLVRPPGYPSAHGASKEWRRHEACWIDPRESFGKNKNRE
jgi:hypothetical protein